MRNLVMISLLVLAACQSPASPSEDAAAGAEATTPVPHEAILLDAKYVCDRDRGALWGRDLCGPILVVDSNTRTIVANQAGTSRTLSRDDDEPSLYRGVLPAEVIIANTAKEWDGVKWTMVMAPLSEDAERRRSLVTHENWHRIQDELGLPAASPVPAHLDSADARTDMRMEWRALSAALLARNAKTAKAAIADALSFRTRRQLAAGPEGANGERQLELNEGLAEYTAVKLTAQSPPEAAAQALAKAEASASFARSFAYASGPAYGLLLDRFDDGWRSRVNAESDLGKMLAAAISSGNGPRQPPTELANARYGWEVVAAEEEAAAREKAAINARWVERLVTRPVLRLPFQNMNIGFDPNGLAPLPPHGTVYPIMTITDDWGILEVTGGGLIDDDWQAAIVPAPMSSETVGDGWTLRLNPGWRISPNGRPGDFAVEREAQ